MRTKTVLEDNSSTVLTKYYALGMYEKEVHATEGTRELYYINTPSGISAILESTSSYDSVFYIHTDILGSYDVITDDQGGIREKLSFDPWGRRRNTSSWDYTGVPASFKFDRGFTGHEHLDDFNLINMNGRMYDPVLAMFLSPDPFIQSPETTQNYNRYAYVMNNPLKYTDPTGYSRSAYLEMLMDRYNYEGGGFWYRGEYYSYYEDYGFVSSSGAILKSSGGGYHYNWFSGNYQDSRGNVVPYYEVYYNFILPSASNTFTIRSITDYRQAMLAAGYKWAWKASCRYIGGDSYIYNGSEITWYWLYVGNNNLSQMFNKLDNSYASIVEGLEGLPYEYGGNGPDGFDCSGAACFGIRESINRNFSDYNADQLYKLFTIQAKGKSRGTLIFYDYESDNKWDHITSNLNNDSMLHPSSGQETLVIVPQTWLDNWTFNYNNGTKEYRNWNWLQILR
ncbi:MAG: RHS repeat-associated core domain-containing protein [Bacteroidales bacterium]